MTDETNLEQPAELRADYIFAQRLMSANVALSLSPSYRPPTAAIDNAASLTLTATHPYCFLPASCPQDLSFDIQPTRPADFANVSAVNVANAATRTE